MSRWVVPLGFLALMPVLMGLGGCPCGDDADCMAGDFCEEGVCVDCRDNADCSEELPVCVDNVCEECGEEADCDDGDACTTDTCDENNECVRDAVTCNDDDVCTTDSCDLATGCVFAKIDCDAGEICDSTTGFCVVDPCFGIVCGEGETCVDGDCQVDLCFDVACDDGDVCTVNSCDPATGNCLADPLCDDGDLCTTDNCDAGVCDFVPTACDQGFTCNSANGQCEASSTSESAVCCFGTECQDNAMGEMYCIDGGGTPISGVTCADNPCTQCVSNAECDDGVDCTDDTCNSGTGVCTNTDNCAGLLSCLGGVDPTICD